MKTILTLLITVNTCLFLNAQILIGKETPSNSSVLLEFGEEAKGVILPSVSSIDEVDAGTFVANTTDKVIQYYDGTDWINLTDEGELVSHNYINEEIVDMGNGVIIGADVSSKSGVLVLESTTQAMVLPKVANPHLNILSPIAGTMVFDTVSASIAVYDGANWSYWN